MVTARDTSDRLLEVFAFANSGRAYSYLGDTGRALEYLEHGLQIAREFGDRSYEGAILFNIAEADAQNGDLPRAIEFANSALVILEEIESPNVAMGRKQLEQWQNELEEGKATKKPSKG